MGNKAEIREFLISRRAHVTPEQAGVRTFSDDRRVPGLRREEVAELAGVSVDYYSRLERGNLQGASDSVLDALARALRLTDVERDHLYALARPTTSLAAAATSSPHAIRPSVQRVLDNFTGPALVYNARQDILAANHLGRALFAPHFAAANPNMARFIFLDSRAPDFYEDWALARSLTAAMLRYEAGRDPLNPDMTALIGELSTRSLQFRRDWADQDVHEHRSGRKTYRHPTVGTLALAYDVFALPGEPGLFLNTYTADPGSPTEEKLKLLAAWTTDTNDQETR